MEKANKLLSGKYVRYQEIGIGEYVIMIVPQKVISWKNIWLIGLVSSFIYSLGYMGVIFLNVAELVIKPYLVKKKLLHILCIF